MATSFIHNQVGSTILLSQSSFMFEPEEVTDYPDYLFLNITTKHAKYILY